MVSQAACLQKHNCALVHTLKCLHATIISILPASCECCRAWKLVNASNIVMVGTPQTEATALALGIADSHTVEVFGTLNTRYGPSTSLISVNNSARLRIVAPNVLRSSMLVDSGTDVAMRVPNVCYENTCSGKGWASAAIAWDS